MTTATLTLMDIENVVGGSPRLTCDSVGDAFDNVLDKIDLRKGRGDRWWVGASHVNRGKIVQWGWATEDEMVSGRGKDGADKALLKAAATVQFPKQFGRLCIASGDHIFAPLARSARAAGATVHVLAPNGSLSDELRRAATMVVSL
jgi:hypothetical protein